MDRDPVFDIFREEARDHLAALEQAFLNLETAAAEARTELINHMFRHAHSLKGDAKVIGLDDIRRAAQSLEDILDELRDNPKSINRAAIDRGLFHFDQVRAAFDSWRTASSPGSAAPAVPVTPEPLPAIESPAPRPASESTAAELAPSAVPAEESFTVRVASERLDRMLNLAAEIRICQRAADATASRLGEIREHLGIVLAGHDDDDDRERLLDGVVDQLRQLDSDWRKNRSREQLLVEALDADIREARLLPLAMLTDSLRRAVRDLSQSLGKPIRYEVQVGRILLDKAVIEALKDPLLHLIRNAADHGLETPEVRRGTGKPEEGVIRIEAIQHGPQVRITVADDGRGVDFERVRQHLRRTGELDDAALAALTKQELCAYLFRPGFSTAPRGEVSGRGVGLDVVQTALRRLHGTVEMQSSSDTGAVFAITAPVTISTVRVLTVVSGGMYYAIPTTSIRQTGRAAAEHLRDLAGGRVLVRNGQSIRWVHLADLLGLNLSTRDNGHAWPYLLITQQGQQIAVAVDDVEDESEVLLKPLGFPLAGLPGIIGATIRANGAVQLVLDLGSPAWGKSQRTAPRTQPKPAARILVVDDSPTTRAVLRNVFTAAGYSVTTATDGLDALERLRSRPVDLIVSDVEMPRLNGFDLTRQVKARFGLPVILVTGREKEEHRKEGMHAGADAYIVKSTFQGQGLLEIVEQFV